MHTPCPDLNEEQDVERLEKRGLDREEIARQDPCCLSLQELAPRQATAGGAGPTPERRSSIAMLVAEARIPSFPNSPLIRM